MFEDLRQIYKSPDLVPILQYGLAIPNRYRDTEAGECPLVEGRQVDRLMAIASGQGFILLPWNAGRMDLGEAGLPQRLFNTYHRYCCRAGIPFVCVEPTGDGRAIVAYDTGHLPRIVDYPSLLWELDMAYALHEEWEDRWLREMMPDVEKFGAARAGEEIGYVPLLIHDPLPLALALSYVEKRVDAIDPDWLAPFCAEEHD